MVFFIVSGMACSGREGLQQAEAIEANLHGCADRAAKSLPHPAREKENGVWKIICHQQGIMRFWTIEIGKCGIGSSHQNSPF